MGPSVLLLGAVEARGPAGPIAVSGTKLQALLAMIALAVPHAVSDDRLIDELWGDDQPANPANSLQAQVSQLRRVLGRQVVVRRGNGYALDIEPDAVDALDVEQLARRAREAAAAGDHRGAAQHFRSAMTLVRGPVLADLLDHDFAREAAGRLEELLLLIQEGLADAELAAGRHAEVVGPLTELARAHPLRERFSAQLITALYRCGRQVDALRAYADVREALIEEFGVEPGKELVDLERAVLAHDPALAAPVAEPVGAGSPPTADPEAGDRAGTRTLDLRPDPTGPGDAFHDTPGRLPLLGRQPELDLLRSDLADAVAGRGRVALLVGEPGIGKTRLAEELADDAEAVGATIGWGRSHDGAAGAAFWPWVQVVRTLLERAPRDLLVAALGRGAADIAQVVPEIHDLLPDVAPPPPLDPETLRFRVCDAITTFLRALARERLLMITLDDIQWADAASLQLLSFLAREITDARILVVVTYRSVGAPADAGLAETLALLVRQPIARRVDLAGLDREALAELVLAVGADPSDDVLTTVHRRTQGNPFFVVEVLRLLPERGVFEGTDDLDAVRQAVPSGVREVIRERLQLLPPETTALLGAAAVLGHTFDVRALAAVAGIDAADALGDLEPALVAGIVVETDRVGRDRFSHGLVNETVYDDLSAATRARAHRGAAEALEAQHGEIEGPLLLEVARHWLLAVPAAPPDPGIRYAIQAARWAEAHLAHDQAEVQLRNALDLIDGLPVGRERDVLELAVQDRLSVLQIVTIGYGSEEVVRASERMQELCQAIDDQELLVPALWRLAIYYCIGMQLDTAEALARQLLTLAGPQEEPTPLLAGHLALGAILSHRGDIAAARGHLDVAAEMVDAGLGAPLVGVVAETPEVWVGSFSAWNWWLHGEEERAEQVIQVALAQAEEADEAYGTMFAVWFSSLLATLRRDPEDVMARCERGLDMASASGFGMFVPYMLVNRGWAVAVEDEFERGCDELTGAAGAIKASGARMMRHVFPAFHADACLANDRHELALAAADDGLAEVEATGERWFEAELHRLRGEALAGIDPSDPEAAAAVASAVRIAERQGATGLLRRAEGSLTCIRAGAPG